MGAILENASNGARELRRERFPRDVAGRNSAFAESMSTVSHEQRWPTHVKLIVGACFLNQLLDYSGNIWAALGRVIKRVFADIGRFKKIQERNTRRRLVDQQKMYNPIAQTLFESFHCSNADSGTDKNRSLRNIRYEATKRGSQFNCHTRNQSVVHVPGHNSIMQTLG